MSYLGYCVYLTGNCVTKLTPLKLGDVNVTWDADKTLCNFMSVPF